MKEEAIRKVRDAEKAEAAKAKAKAAQRAQAARVAIMRQDDPVQATLADAMARVQEVVGDIRAHISRRRSATPCTCSRRPPSSRPR